MVAFQTEMSAMLVTAFSVPEVPIAGTQTAEAIDEHDVKVVTPVVVEVAAQELQEDLIRRQRAAEAPGDTDCAGYFARCTAACETTEQRTWVETVAQSGHGAGCPTAAACQAGDDDCSGNESSGLLVIAVCGVGVGVCCAAALWNSRRGRRKLENEFDSEEAIPVPDDVQRNKEKRGTALDRDNSGSELRATREAQHGQVAREFYEFDTDQSGFLDQSEIGAFCNRLGLLLTDTQVAQALGEMELDSSRDGRIDFDEFLAWWHCDSATKQKGTLAFQLQEAKELAFQAELAGNSPMGRLLAQRNSTPPRDSTRGRTESASHRSGTPPRSARTGTTAVVSTDGVAPVDPPPLNPTRHRGAGAGTPPRSRAVVVDDAVARVLARREAAAAVAGARGRMNTPPRNRS